MNGVRGDVSILPIESYFDHNEIVNMLNIITNGFGSVFWTTVSNNQVSCGTDGYLVSNMRWQNELSIIPTNLNLKDVRE